MQKIHTISNKSIGYIYFIVWAICVMVAFSSCVTQSDKGKIHITGHVLDNNTGLGIAGADVYVLAIEQNGSESIQYPIAQCETGNIGFYQIDFETSGDIEYSVEVHKKGFDHSSSIGIIKSENTNCININLKKNQK